MPLTGLTPVAAALAPVPIPDNGSTGLGPPVGGGVLPGGSAVQVASGGAGGPQAAGSSYVVFKSPSARDIVTTGSATSQHHHSSHSHPPTIVGHHSGSSLTLHQHHQHGHPILVSSHSANVSSAAGPAHSSSSQGGSHSHTPQPQLLQHGTTLHPMQFQGIPSLFVPSPGPMHSGLGSRIGSSTGLVMGVGPGGGMGQPFAVGQYLGEGITFLPSMGGLHTPLVASGLNLSTMGLTPQPGQPIGHPGGGSTPAHHSSQASFTAVTLPDQDDDRNRESVIWSLQM